MNPTRALVTGASQGLGLAIATALADRGTHLVLDARDAGRLAEAAPAGAVLVPGDVTDPAHRSALAHACAGGLDLVVLNASRLGPSPLPALLEHPLDELRLVLETNLVAPVALLQELDLQPGAAVVWISSDAAVEAYPTWGGYGASKAALDHACAVLAVERPDLRVLGLDPGDLRTAMHQAAFPGEDISDRPLPGSVVPALLALLDLPSGRYRAADLLEGASS